MDPEGMEDIRDNIKFPETDRKVRWSCYSHAYNRPWDLLIVITNASLIGNCLHFRLKGIWSVEGLMVVHWIKAVFPWKSPLISQISSICTEIWITIPRKPLQRPCTGSRFWRTIIGAPMFNVNLESGSSEALIEFRHLTGYWKPPSIPVSLSIEPALWKTYCTPEKVSRIDWLRSLTWSFYANRIVHSWK